MNTARLALIARAALGVAGLFAAGAAFAATLQLEPVSVKLTPVSRSAVVRITNSGSEPVNVQVRAFRWSQQDGEDRLEPTDELRVSPPIQAIAPGKEQFVRILLAEDLVAAGESSYRLIIDELPGKPVADGHVDLLIRYSLPVILRPEGLEPPALAFRLVQEPDRTVLMAANTGGQNAQLANLQLVTAGGDTIPVNTGLLGYVLAGRERHWPLPVPQAAASQATGIQAQVDGKAARYPLEVLR